MNCSGQPNGREANVSQPTPPTPQWDRSAPRTADVEETDAVESRHQSSSPWPLLSGLQSIHSPSPFLPLHWHVSHPKIYASSPTPTSPSLPRAVFFHGCGMKAGTLDPWVGGCQGRPLEATLTLSGPWGRAGLRADCSWLDSCEPRPACLEHGDEQGSREGAAQACCLGHLWLVVRRGWGKAPVFFWFPGRSHSVPHPVPDSLQNLVASLLCTPRTCLFLQGPV